MRDFLSNWYIQIDLSKFASLFLWWELALKTRESYDTSIKNYMKYTTMYNRRSLFSTTMSQIVDWVTILRTRKLLAKTIDFYLVSLRSYHVNLDYSDLDLKVFINSLLKRIVVDIKRRNDEINTKKRRSITKNILLKLLEQIDMINLENFNLHTFFYLVFVVFLRIDEFTYFAAKQRDLDFDRWHVTKSFIAFNDNNSMTLYLSVFKIDSWRQDVVISIVATADVACSIKSMKRLFARHLVSSKISLFYIEVLFTRQHVIARLKNLLQKSRIENNYFDHFFKRDVDTWVELRDLFDDEIKVLERWKSNNYRLYIDRDENRMLSYSRRFQMFV